ncbi:MAG: hypothetical protein WBZ48_05755 [Bacteroidota bacterium]
MSIFTELGIPSRTISYSMVYQARPVIEIVEFKKVINESLRNTLMDAALLRDAFQSSLIEARMKSAQVSQGALNQYLSTPIKSDNEDVRRIIKEALEKYSDQILPTAKIGIEAAWNSNIVGDAIIVGSQTKLSVLVRKMLSSGKRTLGHLGFSRGKSSSTIFETVYLLETGINVDLLEYVLRKSASVLDISRNVERTWSGIHTIVASAGVGEQTASLWEASLYPQILGMNNNEFIAEVEKIFEQLSKEFNLHQLSLWQKRFTFRDEDGFTIRVRMIPDQKLLFEIVKWLASTENVQLKQALTANAALIVKEIIS